MTIETISEQRCFGGIQGTYRHTSAATDGAMKFAVYQPPRAKRGKVPVLYFLAGLTCTQETFAIKAGAQRFAAELGLMLVMPDTSPRDTGIGGATGDWEFGEGAGFYLDARTDDYRNRFRMETYISSELPEVIARNFPVADLSRESIFGHSMGGHGALTLALNSPNRYRSVSAFSPIVAPSQVPWGKKAFPLFLGSDRGRWERYDSVSLLLSGQRFAGTILIDQGLSDQFLDTQLKPELFESAAIQAGQPYDLRRHAGYDHSYWFIQSFIEDHLRHHAAALK
ncbi:MAG: S-formylglutathione hydrolase [Dokdonella sp.]